MKGTAMNTELRDEITEALLELHRLLYHTRRYPGRHQHIKDAYVRLLDAWREYLGNTR